MKSLVISSVMVEMFRDASIRYNEEHDREQRVAEGIFFTPSSVRELMFSKLKGLNVRSILEPSFGTGEILLDAVREFPNARVVGVEKNKELFQSVEGHNLYNDDFLNWKGGKFDLIVGNPPYFNIGSRSIWLLFMEKCLKKHLKSGGTLAFVIPRTIYYVAAYQSLRNYIASYCDVEWLIDLNNPGFYETGRETTLIILRKRKGVFNYLYVAGDDNIYMSPNYKRMRQLVNHRTLRDIGASVGHSYVKDVGGGTTPYIHGLNIKGGEIVGDLQGVSNEGVSAPFIVVKDRGYRNLIQFDYAYVKRGRYCIGNDINVIFSDKLPQIAVSLADKRTREFIDGFTGYSLTVKQLYNVLPMFF